jgi:predicted Holliday junction resolvase-like endonuclease
MGFFTIFFVFVLFILVIVIGFALFRSGSRISEIKKEIDLLNEEYDEKFEQLKQEEKKQESDQTKNES